MKKLLTLIGLMALLGIVMNSCLSNDVEDKYKDWRKSNIDWFEAQRGNNTFYKVVTAPWDPNGMVLVHWYNDTMKTKNNLKPLYTSTVDIKYRGMLYDNTPFDSSYLSASPRDSITRLALNATVEGWALGVMQMHVGDSCRIVIPYNMGYGTYQRGTVIKPFSTLVFDLKLDDIYAYEIKP